MTPSAIAWEAAGAPQPCDTLGVPILVSDLMDQVGTSHATLYRVRKILLAAGWRISSEDETIDGVTFARWTIDAWQQLPKARAGKMIGPGRRPQGARGKRS